MKSVYDVYARVTKPVQLSDDAYAALKAARRAGESFSDAVKRALAPRRAIADLARAKLLREDAEEISAEVRQAEELRQRWLWEGG